MFSPVAFHLVPAEIFAAAPAEEPLRVASLETEGFVHLTHRMTDLVEVANAFYRSDPRSHVVLTVRLAALSAPWRYDGDERYPHVYGPIDRDAITEVRPIARTDDGTFLPIERPDPRRAPDLRALLGRLVEGDVAFVVVGSAGAALLGADLVPGDLDVCVATGARNLDRLGAVLGSIGARPRVHVPGWITEEEAAAWRPDGTADSLELLFETDFGDLDVLFASLDADRRSELPYAALLPDARTVDLGGLAVRVALPAHLVASKLASRRPKDLRARAALEPLLAESPQ